MHITFLLLPSSKTEYSSHEISLGFGVQYIFMLIKTRNVLSMHDSHSNSFLHLQFN